MVHRVIYQIESREDAWAICLRGTVLARFQRRERAVRFADLLAQRAYQRHGMPAVVRLVEDGEAVDIGLHGEDDPAARALAWIRHVSVLRGERERAQNDASSVFRRRA